jgi:MYXO-CTERM domain-containing protein
MRQYPGTDIELIALRVDGGLVSRVQNVGIAADDTIVALVSLESDVPALVAYRDGITTVLDTSDTLGAGHYSYNLLVSGMWAVLATTDPAEQALHLTLFDLSTGIRRAIVPPEERSDPTLRPYPSYLTPDGELLLTVHSANVFAPASASWIWRDGIVEVVSDDAAELRESGRPVALAGSGALLLDASLGVNGALSRLSLTGPAATARCPGAAAATTTVDDDGCQVGPAGDVTAWPLLLAAAMWGAARRRRRPFRTRPR